MVKLFSQRMVQITKMLSFLKNMDLDGGLKILIENLWVRIVHIFSLMVILTQVNQLLKYIKFGFGQCLDHVCYDLREGIIDKG